MSPINLTKWTGKFKNYLIHNKGKQMKRLFNISSLAMVLALIVNMLGISTSIVHAASDWETVGSSGFSAGEASYTSIIVDNGTPYVAYQDGANSYKATLMKFDGANWVTVGLAGFSAGEAN